MKGITHIIFGLGASLFFLSQYYQITYLHIIVILAFTTLPDIDVKYKHRRIMHNMFSLIITNTILYITTTYLYNNNIITVPPTTIFITGITAYIIHLFLDSLTKRGIDLFWPVVRKSIGVKTIRYDSTLWNSIISLIGLIMLLLWMWKNL